MFTGEPREKEKPVHYSGITTDLEQRRKQHEADKSKKNTRNWKPANGGKPFASREDAQKWENAQLGEHHPGGAPAEGPWYGYSFDYDR